MGPKLKAALAITPVEPAVDTPFNSQKMKQMSTIKRFYISQQSCSTAMTVLMALRSTQCGTMEAASALEHSNARTDQPLKLATFPPTALVRTTANNVVSMAFVRKLLPTTA